MYIRTAISSVMCLSVALALGTGCAVPSEGSESYEDGEFSGDEFSEAAAPEGDDSLELAVDPDGLKLAQPKKDGGDFGCWIDSCSGLKVPGKLTCLLSICWCSGGSTVGTCDGDGKNCKESCDTSDSEEETTSPGGVVVGPSSEVGGYNEVNSGPGTVRVAPSSGVGGLKAAP